MPLEKPVGCAQYDEGVRRGGAPLVVVEDGEGFAGWVRSSRQPLEKMMLSAMRDSPRRWPEVEVGIKIEQPMLGLVRR